MSSDILKRVCRCKDTAPSDPALMLVNAVSALIMNGILIRPHVSDYCSKNQIAYSVAF